jgi:GT2 family glycosyltransferase
MPVRPDTFKSPPFSMADLAVVVPSHKRVDCLEVCLSSLARFGEPGLQVLVVDDGSAEGRVTGCASRFSGVRVVRNEHPLGFAKAANLGMRMANRPVVQLLNDDARVSRGWAEPALARFADQRVGAVAPLVIMDGAETGRVDSAGDRFTLAGIAGKRGHGKARNTEGFQDSGRGRGRWVLGASASSAFYRVEALRQVNYLDEGFGAYFEDVDLSLRLNRAGWRVWHEPASLIHHRVSSSYGLKPSSEVLRMQARNEERLFWRHMPPPWLFAGAPIHLAALCAKAVRNWQRGTLRPFLQGKRDAWAEALQGNRGPKSKSGGRVNPWAWNLDLW